MKTKLCAYSLMELVLAIAISGLISSILLSKSTNSHQRKCSVFLSQKLESLRYALAKHSELFYFQSLKNGDISQDLLLNELILSTAESSVINPSKCGFEVTKNAINAHNNGKIIKFNIADLDMDSKKITCNLNEPLCREIAHKTLEK